jgi:HTH-type transcriptional regulator, pleiotropic regulator of extracellular virulence genes
MYFYIFRCKEKWQMNSKLGAEIKALRKKHGISQKELAKGICDQSEISRIESGNVYPRVDVLSQLALRLRVNIQHFLSLSNDRTDYINETINYVRALNRLHKYDEMYELTKSELKQRELLDNHYYYCFLKWKYTVAKFKLGKLTYQESVEALLGLTNNKQLSLLHDLLDLRILNSIATIYGESGRYEESIVFYKQILSMDIESDQYPSFITKVINNYSNCLYILRKYSDSITITKKGIKICKEENTMEMIGYLYLQLARCQEKLFDQYPDKEIAHNYYKALFFLKRLGLNSSYISKLKEDKKHFLELITLKDLLDFQL